MMENEIETTKTAMKNQLFRQMSAKAATSLNHMDWKKSDQN